MSRPPIDLTRPETWPVIMRFEEVCAVLDIRPSTGYAYRLKGRFPVPELLPRIAGGPRYFKDDVMVAIRTRSGSATAAERRAALARAK